MNAITACCTVRGPIVVAIFATFACNVAAASNASESVDAPTAVVKYGDLNVASPQGAAVLYGRIREAAEGVCRFFDRPDLGSKARREACIHNAIANAVTEVDQKTVFAIYAAENGTPPKRD